MVSDLPQEIPRGNKRHLGAASRKEPKMFNGESPPEGDGTVHATERAWREAEERRNQSAKKRPPAKSPELERLQRELDAIRDAQARDREFFGRRAESPKPED
jgi:hypothetical protein